MKDALGHGSNAHNAGIEQIPPKGANELRLFADNHAGLYRQSKQPVEANLDKKVAKGVYDHEKSVTLWGYHADRAAQAYNKEHPDRPGQKWHEQFPPAVRQAAAKSWAESYRADKGIGKSATPVRGAYTGPSGGSFAGKDGWSKAQARVDKINTRRKGTF